MDHRLEGLQMEDNRRQTLEKGTEPSRRMSSLCNIPQ